MSSGHTRKPSNRVSIRRSTVGPLSTNDDPLSITTSITADPVASLNQSEAVEHEIFSPARSPIPGEGVEKDLSFLLAPSIYHPLSQLETPPSFRVPLPTVPPEASLSSLREQLDDLLAKGHFLPAAHLSAAILTSDKISHTDLETIFYLLQIRYSCLELTGNTTLAAQEAKALEDLNSAFYFTTTGDSTPIDGERVEEHIMPYALRLQALRLQSLGFGDPRRGISSLYDLGLECREQVALSSTSSEDRIIWRKRLRDLGVRVANALIEMDDLEAAKRTLMSNINDVKDIDRETLTRMILLLLKIGDTTTARELLDLHSETDSTMLQALLCVAEGRWEEAVDQWKAYLDNSDHGPDEPIIKQNLAVALLYIGRLSEARQILEDLVTSGQGYPSLTFNLATLYELSTSNAGSSKRELAERVAQHKGDVGRGWARSNADFKL